MVTRQNADVLLAQLLRRHWGRAADITQRVQEAGFSVDRLPTWVELGRVAPRAKHSLAQLQQQGGDLGGMAPAGSHARALFWSPGDLMEPLVGAAVERLCDLLRQAGLRAGERVANGFSYHLTPAGLLFHEAIVRLGATALPLGPQQAAQAAAFVCRAQAHAYVGTASHLKIVMQEVDALPAHFKRPPLSRALAGAEPFGDALRREIESRWGIECLDFYGTAESGVMALECAQHQGLHVHPQVLVELADPHAPGTRVDDVGELLISADADELPLLRFATGDLVRLQSVHCACGLHTPRIFPLGRVGESVRVRGMLLHAPQLRAFAHAAGLSACRVEVRRAGDADTIEVRWRSQGGEALDEGALGAAFQRACRLRANAFIAAPDLQAGEYGLCDARAADRQETRA